MLSRFNLDAIRGRMEVMDYATAIKKLVDSVAVLVELSEGVKIKDAVLALEEAEQVARHDGDLDLAHMLEEKRRKLLDGL
ncbi:hypothetical protein GF380_04315 [Candidatus Uhrbacteria bacterium]|nr:hypothetical protein [Candidatus Uhrbacteria bacterium]